MERLPRTRPLLGAASDARGTALALPPCLATAPPRAPHRRWCGVRRPASGRAATSSPHSRWRPGPASRLQASQPSWARSVRAIRRRSPAPLARARTVPSCTRPWSVRSRSRHRASPLPKQCAGRCSRRARRSGSAARRRRYGPKRRLASSMRRHRMASCAPSTARRIHASRRPSFLHHSATHHSTRGLRSRRGTWTLAGAPGARRS